MRDDRGKAKAIDVPSSGSGWFSDYYYSSDRPCKKHPSSSSVGICAFCLKDRLIKLVCSDCGEPRLSSCSCSSDFSSSHRNSCTVEVGSVGRISFLIENEKQLSELPSQSTAKPSNEEEKLEALSLLKRSSSASVAVKKSGFWRFGRIFRKKTENSVVVSVSGRDNNGGTDLGREKGEVWMSDHMGVSRTRSHGGFDDNLNKSEDGGCIVPGSGISGVNGEVRRSEKRSNFSEVESRRSVLNGAKQKGYFSAMEDPDFIDLKLSFSPESKSEFSSLKAGGLSKSGSGFSSDIRGSDFLEHECDSFGHLKGSGFFSNRSSSCRITVCDEGIRKGRKSLKVWRWISKQYPSRKSASNILK